MVQMFNSQLFTPSNSISLISNHATLGQWTTASSSAHLVSANPDGPFEWATNDCDSSNICTPPIQPWRYVSGKSGLSVFLLYAAPRACSHNTVVIESSTSPYFQIWCVSTLRLFSVSISHSFSVLFNRHIGDGIVNASVWSPCYIKPAEGAHGVAFPHLLESAPYASRLRASPGNTAYVQVVF